MNPKKEIKLRKRLRLLKHQKTALIEKAPLLTKFIWERRDRYIEPQRQGTPRGEPIGFTKEKYYASLLMMTNKEQKNVAEEAGVSYGLLRKWKTEPIFKSKVAKNHQEFVSVFRERVKERIREQKKIQDELLRKPIEEIAEEIAGAERPTLGWDEFRDAKSYGNQLIRMIGAAMLKDAQAARNENEDWGFSTMEYWSILGALRHFRGISKDPADAQAEKEFRRELERELLNRTKVLLMQPSISDEERKEGVFALSVLEKARA